jgi:diguanylate cyclase (GGDEF)-like protein/PAS domain S-box-containing protein
MRTADDPPRIAGAREVSRTPSRGTAGEVADRKGAGGPPAKRSISAHVLGRWATGKYGPRAWSVYLVLGSLSAFGFFLVSGAEHGVFYDLFYDLVGISAVVAIVAGVRMNRPEYPLPWYLFALGQLMFVAGDLTLNYYENVLHIPAPFPSMSDTFWLGAYPILAVGLALLIRRRAPGREWAGLIDAAIVATGMGVLSWVFLINSYVEDRALTVLERSISIGYPLMDLLLLAVAARLAVTPSSPAPAYRLLGLSLVFLLIADTIYGKMLLDGTYFTGSLPDLWFLLSYVFWGAAALHPTMHTLSEPAPKPRMKVSRTRLALLAAVSLTAPVVRGIQAVRGEPVDVPIIVGGSVVLFLLVFARMFGILRDHERAVDRERILRRAGSALVAAPDREGIYGAALDAILKLVGDTSETRASIVAGSTEKMAVVAAVGVQAEKAQDTQIDPRKLPNPIRSGLPEHPHVVDHDELQGALGFDLKKVVLASQLFVQGESRSAFLIDSDSTLTDEFMDGLEALRSHVALALESAALTEDLHQRQSEERFRALVQNASDVIWILEASGDVRYVSPSIRRILGWTPEKVVDTTVFDWAHPDDVGRMQSALSRCLKAPNRTSRMELRLVHADGSWRRVELIGNNLLDEPTVEGVVFNTRDITERERAKARLREAEAKYRSLVEQIPAVIYMDDIDEANSALYRSPFVEQMLGYTPEECLSMSWQDMLHPDDRERVLSENARTNETGEPFRIEYRMVAKDGHVVWVRDEAMLVKDKAGKPLYWQGVFMDVTERKELEDQLTYQAFHDPLTGLPNRTLFMDRLRRALTRVARRGEQEVALLFLDLDDFKVVNDSLGHKAGDQLLIAVADRLLECVRSADTVARLGGDEFTVLIKGDAKAATRLAERISEELRAPFILEGHEVFVTTSIGISLGVSGDEQAEGFLRSADVAMYEAKSRGKARHEIFDAHMDARALERLQLESEMRYALGQGEFRVYYQPLVKLQTGNITEVEALVRWEHPRRGLLRPDEFIPLAEKTGLIVPIGQQVLEEACRQARSWQVHGSHRDLVVSVNLSPKQLQHPGLVKDIARTLKKCKLDPHNLKLEITESVVMEDADSNIAILRKLRGLGIQLAIDDFGTGYSSLSYLKNLPVHVLKIDRSFVGGLGRVPEDTAIVRATVAFARSMGMSVTAEGIETAEQLAYVRALDCDLGQGYYLSRPLPSETVGELLSAGAEPFVGQEEWAISDVASEDYYAIGGS